MYGSLVETREMEDARRVQGVEKVERELEGLRRENHNLTTENTALSQQLATLTLQA